MLGRLFLSFALFWVIFHGVAIHAAPAERDPFSELPEVLQPKQDRTERDFDLVEVHQATAFLSTRT